MSTDYNDPVQVYLREVKKFQPLTQEEESALLQTAQTGPRNEETECAARRLVEANLHLVVSIAERHQFAGMPLLNLIENGNLGLMNAIETFGQIPSRTFSAHAAICIEHAISNAITERESGNR